jgi:hypothetical protein
MAKSFDEKVVERIENNSFLKSDVRIPLNLRKGDGEGAGRIIGQFEDDIKEVATDQAKIDEKRQKHYIEGDKINKESNENYKKMEKIEAEYRKQLTSEFEGLENKLKAVVDKVGLECIAETLSDYAKFKRSMLYLISQVKWNIQDKVRNRIRLNPQPMVTESVAKSIQEEWTKAQKIEQVGGSLVAGQDPKKKVPYKRLCIMMLQMDLLKKQAQMYESDPDKLAVINMALITLSEQFDALVATSAGKGLITEEELTLVGNVGDGDYSFQSVFDAHNKSFAMERVTDELRKAMPEVKKIKTKKTKSGSVQYSVGVNTRNIDKPALKPKQCK